MNAKRLNLIGSVRAALEDAGISTVKVIAAVNAELGRLQQGKGGSEAKLGDGRVTKSEYRVTENLGSVAWKGARSPGLEFDAWHSCQAKAAKIAEQDKTPIPSVFDVWLQHMKADAAKPVPAAPAAPEAPKNESQSGNGALPLAPVAIPAELTAKLAGAKK